MKTKIFLLFTLCMMLNSLSSHATPGINDCTDRADDGVSDKTDISAVMSKISGDWSNFESDVESSSGRIIQDALERDFNNGNVDCDYSSDFLELCFWGGSAESIPLGRIFLCGDFIDGLHGEAQKDRRACYAAILTETFALSNLKTAAAAEALGQAAFYYWVDRFGSDIAYDDCGI